MNSCKVVFNLQPFAASQFFLPTANIVQVDRDGEFTYILQKATPETLRPYGLEVTPLLTRLFRSVETLSVKAIEVKHKPSKAKSFTPLAQLLSNPATKQSVEDFIFRELDVFLAEIVQNRLPITFDAAKKSLVKDHLITYAEEELLPHLQFKKTPEGMEYRLQLGTETEKWIISQRQAVPLTNTVPAWILVENRLFRVPGINGKLIGPFQKKDVVHIPAKNVREYLHKIIVKSANRTSIEAEGFEVETRQKLLATEIALSEDFLQKTWLLNLQFRYEGRVFEAYEKRNRFTWVEFPDAESFVVKQIRRDLEAENAQVEVLKNAGLRPSGPAFALSERTDFEAAVRWLAEHRVMLAASGFEIAPPEAEGGRKIALISGEISVSAERKTDWFDVQGTVRAGDFEFPFKKIAPFLRRGDPFFPLPDGSFFLIPAAWFARFSELAQTLNQAADGLRLPKTLFTVLQSADIQMHNPEGFSENPHEAQKIDFQAPASLRAQLRPYQLEGVQWLIEHHRQGFGACLADDMGLGKTLQTIAVLLWAKERNESRAAFSEEATPQISAAAARPVSKRSEKPASLQLDLFAAPIPDYTSLPATPNTPTVPLPKPRFSALIILPASLIFNWRAELDKFSEGLFAYTHTGPKRHDDPRLVAAHDVVLTTYHTARNDLDLLGSITWDYVVLDESQQIKNRESEISQVVRKLRAKHKISLSGTPIENSLADLWTQMEFINPATLGSFEQFRRQFLLPIERDDDPVAKAALYRRVQPFFLRRTKKEVAPDLPELTEQVFFSAMKPAQKELYEREKSAVRNQILSLFDDPKSQLLVIQALTRLRQIALHPDLLPGTEGGGASGKFDDVLAELETLHRSGHKVLVFSSFEKYLRMLRQTLEQGKRPFAWLTGETPNDQRGREVERFQTDPAVQIFMATTKAGGAGINLTAANYVFLLDPWWNPAVEAQAIARAHRIGSKNPVTAVRFISVGTVEEKIRDLQARKAKLSEGLFAGEQHLPHLSRTEWEEVLA